MMRYQTGKYDKKPQTAFKAIKKIKKPDYYAQKSAYNKDPNALSYAEQMHKERVEEEQEIKYKQWEKDQIALKKANYEASIKEGYDSGDDLITAAEYYLLAQCYYNGTNGVEVNKPLAAQTYWTALICGEPKAAFELFSMLYYGDGIAQNAELAAVFLGRY